MSVKVSIKDATCSYHVHLVGRNEQLLEELEYGTTEEVITLLRSPITMGDYYQTATGRLYSWNPMKDIVYEESDTKNGPMSLTFLQPRVENERFLNGTYVIPQTAKDVLETSLGEEVLMVATPDLVRYEKNWKRCWNVWFMKSDLGEGLRSMEQEVCTIHNVALLFECLQIIDTDTGIRYPTRILINKLDEVNISDELIRHGRMGEYLSSR